MADAALRVLEGVRREAVLAAQRVLAEACADLAQHETQVLEARVARLRCDEELQSERAQAVGTNSALQLRRAEERLRGLSLELKHASARLTAAQDRCSASRVRAERARAAVVEAETGRRAVSQVLGEREQQELKRRELRDEDDASDAWNAQRFPPGR